MAPSPRSTAPQPTFFATPADFRRWLEGHHESASELWVGFHKKATGRPSLTWPESVDEALWVGWIDGIRKSIDGDSYMIRFTPRKRESIWSAVNTRRAAALIAGGRMRPAGLVAFEARDPAKTAIYSYEQRTRVEPAFDAESAKRFRAHPAAWRFFAAQPPGYRRLATGWVTGAKREETRTRRLAALIADSAAGRRIDMLRPPSTAGAKRRR